MERNKIKRDENKKGGKVGAYQQLKIFSNYLQIIALQCGAEIE